MKISVLTLFPEMFAPVCGVSILKRALDKNLFGLEIINIRDYSEDKHKRVDDYPYGAGGGLLMQPMPIYGAYEAIVKKEGKKPYVIYMSPQGKTFDQKKAIKISKMDSVVILCGHYEGVDQRVLDEIVDEEISIGDFVLTGGELAAMAVIDASARMIPGVLDSEDTFSHESHYDGLLEYPQYTRPPVWHGMAVPDILVSGHHANIEKWRREQSIINTLRKRPEMLEKAPLDEKEREFVKKMLANEEKV